MKIKGQVILMNSSKLCTWSDQRSFFIIIIVGDGEREIA